MLQSGHNGTVRVYIEEEGIRTPATAAGVVIETAGAVSVDQSLDHGVVTLRADRIGSGTVRFRLAADRDTQTQIFTQGVALQDGVSVIDAAQQVYPGAQTDAMLDEDFSLLFSPFSAEEYFTEFEVRGQEAYYPIVVDAAALVSPGQGDKIAGLGTGGYWGAYEQTVGERDGKALALVHLLPSSEVFEALEINTSLMTPESFAIDKTTAATSRSLNAECIDSDANVYLSMARFGGTYSLDFQMEPSLYISKLAFSFDYMLESEIDLFEGATPTALHCEVHPEGLSGLFLSFPTVSFNLNPVASIDFNLTSPLVGESILIKGTTNEKTNVVFAPATDFATDPSFDWRFESPVGDDFFDVDDAKAQFQATTVVKFRNIIEIGFSPEGLLDNLSTVLETGALVGNSMSDDALADLLEELTNWVNIALFSVTFGPATELDLDWKSVASALETRQSTEAELESRFDLKVDLGLLNPSLQNDIGLLSLQQSASLDQKTFNGLSLIDEALTYPEDLTRGEVAIRLTMSAPTHLVHLADEEKPYHSLHGQRLENGGDIGAELVRNAIIYDVEECRQYEGGLIPSLLVAVGDLKGLELPGFVHETLDVCRGFFTLDLPAQGYDLSDSNGGVLNVNFTLINNNTDTIGYRIYIKDEMQNGELLDVNDNPIGDYQEGTFYQPAQIDYGYSFTCPDKENHILTLGVAALDTNGNIIEETETSYPIAIDCGAQRHYRTLGAGATHAVAIDVNGSLWVWGDNTYSQLGLGSEVYAITPKSTMRKLEVWDPNAKFLEVSTYLYTTLALDDQGRVWSWGDSDKGETGQGAYDTNNDPDNRLVAYNPGVITFPDDAADIVSIAMGGDHALALDANGTVWAWGPSVSVSSVTVTADPYDEEIFMVQPSPIKVAMPEGVKIKQIAAGTFTSYAIDVDSGVWTRGVNTSGELGPGSYDAKMFTPHPYPTKLALQTAPTMLSVASHYVQGAKADEEPFYFDANMYKWYFNTLSSYPNQVMLLNGIGDVWS